MARQGRVLQRLVSSVGRLLGRRRISGSAGAAPSDTKPYVRRIVSDAILLNEIPSPTEKEAARMAFLFERLNEFGYVTSAIDEHGNVAAVVPGRDGAREHVLLFADVRSEDFSPLESMSRLTSDRLSGKGIAGSSVPAAALLVLAEYLARNSIQYNRGVVLLFTSFDPAAGDTQPLQRFLQEWKDRVLFAAHLRGLDLGHQEERPLGTCRLSVTVRTADPAPAGGEPRASAILVLANIASRLGAIRWDTEDRTFLSISRVEAGTGFGWPALEGVLELEVFSVSSAALDLARQAVEATIASTARETGAEAAVAVKAFLPAGDPSINEELAAVVREVHGRLRIAPRPSSLPGYASVLNLLGIPTVTLGITTGRRSLVEEYVDIGPIETGFRQLLAFLDACAGWQEGHGA